MVVVLLILLETKLERVVSHLQLVSQLAINQRAYDSPGVKNNMATPEQTFAC